MLGIMVLAIIIWGVVCYWQIAKKAGYSGWWGLLMLIPFAGIIIAWVFPFAEWPIFARKGGGGSSSNLRSGVLGSPSTQSVASAATTLNPTPSSPPSQNDQDAIYATVANELETGQTDKGLWTRLYAENDGDDKKTKVAYIKERAGKLISLHRTQAEQKGLEEQACDEFTKQDIQRINNDEKLAHEQLRKTEIAKQRSEALVRIANLIRNYPDAHIDTKKQLINLLGGTFKWDEGVFTTACTVNLFNQEHKFVKSKDFDYWIVRDVVPLVEVAISTADVAKCPFCGVSVEAGSAVCKSCNRVLDKPKAAPRLKTCPDCGVEMTQDSIACAKCGRVTY